MLHEEQQKAYIINKIELEKLLTKENCYRLKLEHLSEKRPRLIIGSNILIQRNHLEQKKRIPFKAVVVAIEPDRTHIHILLDKSFKWKEGYFFAVNFSVDRTPYIRVAASIHYFEKQKQTEMKKLEITWQQSSSTQKGGPA